MKADGPGQEAHALHLPVQQESPAAEMEVRQSQTVDTTHSSDSVDYPMFTKAVLGLKQALVESVQIPTDSNSKKVTNCASEVPH
jgi:hypothetical protein